MTSNPYWGTSFFSFIGLFLKRIALFCQGKIPFNELASDEIQILVLALIGISSALVGTFLVLRKMTMLANSLSHTILLGLVIVYLIGLKWFGGEHFSIGSLSLPLLFFTAFLTGFLTTSLTEFFTKVTKIQQDASIGLVFTFLFALGVTLITVFTRNAHIGVEAIMGNVDALHFHDLKFAFVLFLFNGILFLLFFKEYAITTFDPVLAKNLGISIGIFHYLLMFQTASTAIGAFRAVGVILFLILLVGPVLTARLFVKKLKTLLLLSSSIAILVGFFSVALSRHILSIHQMPLSTAGIASSMMMALFFVCCVIHKWKKEERVA